METHNFPSQWQAKEWNEEGAGKKVKNSICKDAINKLTSIRFCTCQGISSGSAFSVCMHSEVRHAVNVQRLRHADTDTEACWQLSAMATGVATEMVQLLHGYIRVISMHHQALLFSTPPPCPCLLSVPWTNTTLPDVGGWNANSEGSPCSILLHVWLGD